MRRTGRAKAQHNGRAHNGGPVTAKAGVDRAAIEDAVRTIIRAIGENPSREGLAGTLPV